MKKTAFIALVGRPNVGKSTLLNALMQEKIAIVSPKPQTTRNRISGIFTEGEDQFVFFDTPGIFQPRNALGDVMVKTANTTMQDGDAIVLVADVDREPGDVETNVIRYAKQSGVPCILVLNKTDLVDAPKVAESITAYAALHEFHAIIPMSARSGRGVDAVMTECRTFLHESEWFYPEDIATDQPVRQMAAEIIREKVLRTTNKEIPHGVAVLIEKYTEDKKTGMVSIHADIYCEKASHKGIIVGKGGEGLRRIGTYAREDLEKLLDAKVYLNLWVKVKENWRDSAATVTNLGYHED